MQLTQNGSTSTSPAKARGAATGRINGESLVVSHPSDKANNHLPSSYDPSTPTVPCLDKQCKMIALELEDGLVCYGYSFGAEKSVAGELVFQTGMVGYPESLTDPSYRGQILVITFPLIGNYGVPSRATRDSLLRSLPAFFESNEIHVAGLVIASYSGENYSHYLATSSLGTWLKEQGVPAMYAVDTRALTKRIREEGSMLCKMLLGLHTIDTEVQREDPALRSSSPGNSPREWQSAFSTVDWSNPNGENLVAQGNVTLQCQ